MTAKSKKPRLALPLPAVRGNNRALILLLLVSLFLWSCQTKPIRYDDKKEGYWQSKVLIKDKRQNKSYIVHVDMNAVMGESLRLDVTNPIGGHLASLVLSDDEVKYLLLKQKKFFLGKPTPTALQPLISIPLDPVLLYNILFDKPIAQEGWACQKSADEFLSSCHSEKEQISMKFSDRVMDRKIVHIDHPKAHLQMNFVTYESQVQQKKNLFSLDAPKDFQVIRLR